MNRSPMQRCVLVVDDHTETRQAFQRALEGAGFCVLVAGDGRGALELAVRHHPAVVLLDAALPDMAGEDVMARLRLDPASAQPSVIMVSGKAAVQRKVAGLRGGADDYLDKPVWPEELVARVQGQFRLRDHWFGQVQEALASRSDLARLLVALDANQALPHLVTDMGTVLRERLGVVGVAISPLQTDQLAPPVKDAGGDQTIGRLVPSEASRAPMTVPGTGRSDVHVPLEANGVTFAVLTVAVIERPDRALATLIDLAPQISALLHPAVRADVAMWSDRRDVESALAPGGCRALFQPIVELPSMAVVGFEGLCRFNDGGQPDRRFKQAARIGLGAALEVRAIEEILAAAELLPRAAWVSLNVSVDTLLAVDLGGLLGRRDRRVRLEITEHEQISDYSAVAAAVARLDGVELSVDDTGSGYASLRHVYELRPTMVKLDRTWISGIDEDPLRRALVTGLASFTAELGAVLVGEGVERPTESLALASLGVPLAQGFLYGRPAPPSDWA